MQEDEKIKYKKKLKEIFNNSYTILFSAIAFVVFILSLLNFSKIGGEIALLQQVFYSFSWANLLFLGIIFSGSAVLAHFKKFGLMFLPILFWLLITTGMVRTANIPNLIDVSTGNYTLGPDLDPFLFLRNAIELSEGIAGETDFFRYAPLGAPSYINYNLMPWAIYGLYNFLSIFSKTSITYAAIIAPVIFFLISVIGFFLFTKTISSFKFSKEKSWIISIIATAFYIFVPSMVHRTVAGIPELESLGMAFFWFAFLFISLAWKTENKKKQILFGVLAGIFTGAMSWTWGGYKYIYLAIFLTSFLIFLIEKDKSKNRIIFSSWFISAIILESLKVSNIISVVSSVSDTGLALFLFGIIWFEFILFETPLKEKLKKLNKIKIPNSIKSLIILILLGLIIGLIISPEKILSVAGNLIERLLYPFGRERVGLTVSENQVPYFTDVINNFGNMFWLFFFGTIILFYEAVKHFNKKKKLVLFSSFIIFITTFIFSRISEKSQILNGETFVSKSLYLGGLILFAIVLLWTFISAYKNKDEKTIQDFKEIDFSYLLILAISVLMIVSMRGAIRLFFIVSPCLILVAAFLPIKIYEFGKSKDSLTKLISLVALVIIILTMIGTFANYSSSTVYAVKTTVPSSYNQQWQYAMEWVRDNTNEGSIFVHWWDYGYWIQTLGERPTVTDGGHYINYWDHLTARYLLTTQKPETALSLMKSYNVSYLLIDSTDLGKYSAYSKIGGDENYDTFSSIPIGTIDKSQTKETQNTTVTVYPLNGFVDEDIFYKEGDKEIFISGPTYNEYGVISAKAYLVGLILRNEGEKFYQPAAVFYSNNKQINLPVRYIYYDGELIDFGTGIESIIKIIPSLNTVSGGLSLDEKGATIYLSPKVSKSLFAQLYLLEDSMNKYPTVELAHSEQSSLVKQMLSNGYYGGEFIYYGGSLYGPIKIWKVKYPENIVAHDEFLEKSGEYASLDNLTFIND
jgi:asparagine N-glycosylation enzyme membrane subunit Stt3